MMRRALAWLTVLAGVVVVALWWARRDRTPVAPTLPASAASSEAVDVAPTELLRRPPGRAPARPDPEWVAAARSAMTDPREGSCGPYRLISDAMRRDLREACESIGTQLEEVYRSRFGLEPVGEPRGVVLLFADRADYRRFAVEIAGLRAGYAGFSRTARGIVALHAEVPRERFSATLAHELTHLLNRRALGSDLPPWLSEGLSDAIGDAVDESGLTTLSRLEGVEPQAARLAAAYAEGRAPTLEQLVTLRRDQFDRGSLSLDYEQSALLVRLLLTDDELANRFRAYLDELAAGETYAPEELAGALGISLQALDRRLAAWLD